MSEVIVDTEKLEYGLERGIGKSDTIYAAREPKYRLRYSPCGLVSSGIYEYLAQEGIPAKQVISSPNLTIDPEMRHVMPVVGANIDPTIVDAAFSQFLGYVGIMGRYEELTGKRAFPDEKIIDFPLSRHSEVSEWLTMIATQFLGTRLQPLDDLGMKLIEGRLENASVQEIRQAYEAIWDPANFEDWHPPERVVNHGKQISRFIPDGAIDLR